MVQYNVAKITIGFPLIQRILYVLWQTFELIRAAR